MVVTGFIVYRFPIREIRVFVTIIHRSWFTDRRTKTGVMNFLVWPQATIPFKFDEFTLFYLSN